MRSKDVGDVGDLIDLLNGVLGPNGLAPAMDEMVSKLPDCLVAGTYPPADIYRDEDGAYTIEMAVAGWREDELILGSEDMKLTLELKPIKADKERVYLQHSIRHSHAKISFAIHPRYDLKSIKAVYKDGILTVKLPIKEEAKASTITIARE